MTRPLRLMGVLAHPDDESLGIGGVLARYSREGVITEVVTATRGDRGRFFHDEDRPDNTVVGEVREGELRAAARELGVSRVQVLGYGDGRLDRADPAEATSRIAAVIRRARPHVVVTFGPFGAYGHPDHIAVSQLTTAAVMAAADPAAVLTALPAEALPAGEPNAASAAGESARETAPGPWAVSKLYYIAWDERIWVRYQDALKRLTSRVDGVERHAAPWPDWSITTRVDARADWETVWRAVQCHQTQVAVYGVLKELTASEHEQLWGLQTFYRAFSRVNGGRVLEDDLFAGLR